MKRLGDIPVTRTRKPEPPRGDEDWLVWAAWADRVTFEEILEKTGLSEKEVIKKMRQLLSKKTFCRWRRRVHEKSLKHRKLFKLRRRESRPVERWQWQEP